MLHGGSLLFWLYVPQTMFEEKRLLLIAYDEATTAYSHSLNQLKAQTPVLPKEQYERLRTSTEVRVSGPRHAACSWISTLRTTAAEEEVCEIGACYDQWTVCMPKIPIFKSVGMNGRRRTVLRKKLSEIDHGSSFQSLFSSE